MILDIVKYPDPVLRQNCKVVGEITDEIKLLAAYMIETMDKNGGVGLAANQVGIPIRLIVYKNQENDSNLILVNPVLIKEEGFYPYKEDGVEGCLSLPGIEAKIIRNARVRVKGAKLDGGTEEFIAQNSLARVIQHEIDHLNGILIIDRMSAVDKFRSKSKLHNLIKNLDSSK